MASSRTEDAVGEDVAAIGVLRELDLVDGHEVRAFGDGHGFDGAGVIARAGRLDAFFAGDEGAGLGAFLLHHPVIDLAREQAQRQADHPRIVRKHALNGEMGLAGIRRAENGPDTLVVAGGQSGRSRNVGRSGDNDKTRKSALSFRREGIGISLG